ncbi:hypothetical protein [Actinacidiphila epipremni]|jgi:hypothetical protein|uniref:Uncharacterized protein n=1 Tax=Actinacidiphila epipremni TaxID=2053013 RepID=A0ABX0ZX54_9ACTN|nr:hypothetical protein [Actinacidiphila epipremni]NJP46171.1 hypothetical protein [Actinacidiphila epipremni]
MSRARARRPPSGGVIPWTLSLPARLHIRWLVILVVTGAAMAAYAHVLLTAPPMPPSHPPHPPNPPAAASPAGVR